MDQKRPEGFSVITEDKSVVVYLFKKTKAFLVIRCVADFHDVTLILSSVHAAPWNTWNTYGELSERQDNEIAQEIQEELARQAERQRQQEEEDAVRNAHQQTNTHTQTFSNKCFHAQQ